MSTTPKEDQHGVSNSDLDRLKPTWGGGQLLSTIYSILDRLLGEGRYFKKLTCQQYYATRWYIFKKKWGGYTLALNHFFDDDHTRDFHDHPKRFISIGLWGSYVEETPRPGGIGIKQYRAPWIRTFPAEHAHTIHVPGKNCWTLVLMLKGNRHYRFWHHDEDGNVIARERERGDFCSDEEWELNKEDSNVTSVGKSGL